MKLSVIIVNYNSQEVLQKCLSSLQKYWKSAPFQWEVIVVNNDSQPLFLPDFSFSCSIIDICQNVGFAAANNSGAMRARGELLFFLNPDTLITDTSFFEMISYLAKNSSVGVIAPCLILPKNRQPQPWTCGSKTSLRRILFKNTFLKPWKKHSLVKVDWVSGAALLTKKRLFNQVGGFDENFFMYFEDQDLCLRIKQLGFEVIFFPFAKVIHLNGQSWKNAAQQKQYFYRSQDYFFQKHHSLFSASFLKIIRKLFKQK